MLETTRAVLALFLAATAIPLAGASTANGSAGARASVRFATAASATAGESAAPHRVALTLDLVGATRLAAPVSVRVATASGSAVAGSDFAALSQAVVFPRGARHGDRAFVDVAVLADTLVEGREVFDLVLDQPQGGALGRRTRHEVAIGDDDHASVAFASTDGASGDEQSLAHPVALVLVGTSGATLTRALEVEVRHAGGSAQLDADFAFDAATVCFDVGAVVGETQSVALTVLADTLAEDDELVLLELGSTTARRAIGGATRHRFTIVDDDQALAPAASGPARLHDLDRDGRASAGDQVVLRFSAPVVVHGAAPEALALLVAGDSFGSGALLAAGPRADEVTVTLGTGAHLRARQTFDAGALGDGAASGLDVSASLPQDAIEGLFGADARATSPVDLVAAWVAGGALASGNDASALALFDLDGDGDLDAAVGNRHGPVALFTNTGNGDLVDAGSATGPGATTDLAAGDLDRDGDLDLVVARAGEPSLLLLNDGRGHFADAGQVFPVATTSAIALGDLDRDGDLDLVIANHGEPSTVWHNSGGLFVATTPAIAAASTNAVALGDVDGDGDLDAVLGNYVEGTTVQLNDGSGHFVDSQQDLHGMSHGIMLGDIDGDGDLDVVRAREGANTVWVNDGSGVYAFPGQVLGSHSTSGAVLSDLDTDGDLDLACADRWDSDHVYWNDGAGTFADSGLDFGYQDSSAIECGDMDRDGDLDLVVASHFGGCRVLWASTSGAQGADVLADSGAALASGLERAAAVGDVDRDGDLDLVLGCDGPTSVWANDGHGAFADAGQAFASGNSTAVRLGDVDGDGDLDAVVSDLALGTRVVVGDGHGSFQAAPLVLATQAATALDLGDVDGDGDLDLVVAGADAACETVWLGDGHGAFASTGAALGASGASSIALGDLDGDGDLDLVIGVHGGEDRVLSNDGHGVFADTGALLGTATTRAIALVDLDRDGDLDLVEACDAGALGRVLANDGAGHFGASVATFGDGASTSLCVGDLDLDGDLDLVVGDELTGACVHLGDGAGHLTPSASPAGAVAACAAVVLLDADRDGDLDVWSVLPGAPDRLLVNR
jgi:hypothetical protein